MRDFTYDHNGFNDDGYGFRTNEPEVQREPKKRWCEMSEEERAEFSRKNTGGW
jgi:hypothetical protein